MSNGFINIINILLLTTGSFLLLSLLLMSIVSISEKEYLAFKRSLFLILIVPSPFFILGLINFPLKNLLSIILLSIILITIFLILIPSLKKTKPEDPKGRIDERDIPFSRAKYIKGTKRYQDYYNRFPDKKIIDDKIKAKPGLLKKGSLYFDDIMFASSNASFTAIDGLAKFVKGKEAEEKINTAPADISKYIKNWGKHLGAQSVGITYLKDYHLYSHTGRGEDYGKKIEKDYKYAIAFTVEMDHSMFRCAPKAPAVMESSKKYVDAAIIAVQLTLFIRNLGYSARPHIDANYQVVCPLVARDAGLGEIGRMGLLMTPKSGPRVRIGVITTNLPLIIDKRNYDHSVEDFCKICKKCAHVCPSKAISFEDKKNINGVNRWQINSDRCYDYWCTVGTDCGRGISVCPYSHPNNFIHNIIRFFIKHSKLFRIIANYLDDFFYGKKPLSARIPKWMIIKKP